MTSLVQPYGPWQVQERPKLTPTKIMFVFQLRQPFRVASRRKGLPIARRRPTDRHTHKLNTQYQASQPTNNSIHPNINTKININIIQPQSHPRKFSRPPPPHPVRPQRRNLPIPDFPGALGLLLLFIATDADEGG